MFIYYQSSGELWWKSNRIATGYAGNGAGLNNPNMQCVKDVGPLPRGIYTIGEPFTHPEKGEYCLRLSPDAANEMCGRDGFLIHGDRIDAPGQFLASDGCIIMARSVRVFIAQSGDKELWVTSKADPNPPSQQEA